MGCIYRIPGEKLALYNWYRHGRVNVASGFGAESKNLSSCLSSGGADQVFYVIAA